MKLLFVHQTRSGSICATGQLLANLSSGLADRGVSFSEISFDSDSMIPVSGWHDMEPLLKSGDMEGALANLISEECPDLIIYRPDSRLKILIEPLLKIKERSSFSLLVSFMDIWNKEEDAPLVEKLISSANGLWFISEPMRDYYQAEFKNNIRTFIVANGVDEKYFRFPDVSKIRNLPMVCRFFGSINEYQTYEGLDRFCSAISTMPDRFQFEIYSRQHITKLARSLLRHDGVRLCAPIEGEGAYFGRMQAADVLVVPYSWSKECIAYLKYSFGNKIPECLASGKPVVALGSEDLFNISYLKGNKLAEVVTEADRDIALSEIKEVLGHIYAEYDNYLVRARSIKKFAFDKFGLESQREKFVEMINMR